MNDGHERGSLFTGYGKHIIHTRVQVRYNAFKTYENAFLFEQYMSRLLRNTSKCPDSYVITSLAGLTVSESLSPSWPSGEDNKIPFSGPPPEEGSTEGRSPSCDPLGPWSSPSRDPEGRLTKCGQHPVGPRPVRRHALWAKGRPPATQPRRAASCSLYRLGRMRGC